MRHLTFDVGRSLLSALTQDQEPASVQQLQIANGDVFSLQHDRFFDDQFDLNGISHSRSFALTGMFPSSISPKAKQQTSFLIPIHFFFKTSGLAFLGLVLCILFSPVALWMYLVHRNEPLGMTFFALFLLNMLLFSFLWCHAHFSAFRMGLGLVQSASETLAFKTSQLAPGFDIGTLLSLFNSEIVCSPPPHFESFLNFISRLIFPVETFGCHECVSLGLGCSVDLHHCFFPLHRSLFLVSHPWCAHRRSVADFDDLFDFNGDQE